MLISHGSMDAPSNYKLPNQRYAEIINFLYGFNFDTSVINILKILEGKKDKSSRYRGCYVCPNSLSRFKFLLTVHLNLNFTTITIPYDHFYEFIREQLLN
jgi:hypothetical protein